MIEAFLSNRRQRVILGANLYKPTEIELILIQMLIIKNVYLD